MAYFCYVIQQQLSDLQKEFNNPHTTTNDIQKITYHTKIM